MSRQIFKDLRKLAGGNKALYKELKRVYGDMPDLMDRLLKDPNAPDIIKGYVQDIQPDWPTYYGWAFYAIPGY